ncbi:uncharacterized protein LOC113277699 [Papaver somniferum]|uniref:uncharacterized protein LOC113277699 n=1 Tax=Papaver somniferum TaxID=3469 RepID=UPI000E6FB996|nr:uncharacterized protein LOC113277699 [Papaver somniferum]
MLDHTLYELKAVEQLGRQPTRPCFNESSPTPDRIYDHSPIQRDETWAGNYETSLAEQSSNQKFDSFVEAAIPVMQQMLQATQQFCEFQLNYNESLQELQRNIDNIRSGMNQIQEEWNKEEVQTHSNIPMEANIEYDESEEDEYFNVDNEGVTSSTHDHNDHSPIQKEEVESINTTIIDGKTFVVYESDDDYEFFVNNTPNSEILNTLNEKSTCDEARKDYDDLLGADFDSDDEDLEVIEETDEEWLVKSLNENCDTCDVGESMDFFRSTEDPVMRETMRGLSIPLHEPLSNDDPPKLEVVSCRVVNPSFRKIPHLGLELNASKVLSEFLASKYPPYMYEFSVVQVSTRIPSTSISYIFRDVERTKCGGDSYVMIVSLLLFCANILVKLLLELQIVLWVDPQIFRLLIYGESISNAIRMRQSGEQFQFLLPCLFQVFLLFFLQWFETLRTMFDLSVGVGFHKNKKLTYTKL